MTREERIKAYAYTWYEFRKQNKRPGNAQTDWEKAEHIVDSEDREEARVHSQKENNA